MKPDFRLIEGAYVQDLRQQPDAIWETTQALAEGCIDDLCGTYRFGAFDRVLLTGMGSSFHALQVLAPALTSSGLPVITLETGELVHSHLRQISSRSLVITVSQSGASAETLRLLDVLPDGAHLAAVTNSPTSPLALRAHSRILTEAGPETTVSCKTYVATVAALLWLGEVLSGALPRTAAERVGRCAEAAADYLSWWRDHAEQLAQELADASQLFVVGRGTSLAAAATGGLIIKEAARFPAEAMSSAAFRHGPIEMATSDSVVLVLEGTAPLAALNRDLAASIRQLGGRACIVGPGADITSLKVPVIDDLLLPMLEILPLQIVSLALAGLAGVEAGCFSRASKVTSAE